MHYVISIVVLMGAQGQHSSQVKGDADGLRTNACALDLAHMPGTSRRSKLMLQRIEITHMVHHTFSCWLSRLIRPVTGAKQ